MFVVETLDSVDADQREPSSPERRKFERDLVFSGRIKT
jgi:hypothetical protein